MKTIADTRPLIAHVIFRFDYGGLENGLVNLVNALPEGEFRHAIIALTSISDFKLRLERADVELYHLDKRAGQDLGAYWRLFILLRKLRPTVVHTRNVGTLDCALVASLAGVPFRVHGEHGWDVHDPDGTNRKYLFVRRIFFPLVDRVVAVSEEIERWLRDRLRVTPERVRRICNGVDIDKFDRERVSAEIPPDRVGPGHIVVGSVTRFNEIKDPLTLVRAFISLRRRLAPTGPDVRLVMIGSGPLHTAAVQLLEAEGLGDFAWLPGSRDDVASLLKRIDLFVLASRREGISNTVLEAMASGLPVVASATGGNCELVVPGETGALVAPGDVEGLADACAVYVRDAAARAAHGAAGKVRARERYSLARMVSQYRAMYLDLCREKRAAAGATL